MSFINRINNNGLWESSRFIGPELKDAIRQQQKKSTRIDKPILDEQEVHLVSSVLSQSQIYKKPVQITLYDEFQPRTIVGIVTRSRQGEFRLDSCENATDEWEWISYQLVMKAELNKDWSEDEMLFP